MYVVFRDNIMDSDEYKAKIEEGNIFKVEKDLTPSTKREDVLAYIISRKVDGNINPDDEEQFDIVMKETDEAAASLIELFPKYTIMESGAYKLDPTEGLVYSLVLFSSIDLTRRKLKYTIFTRMLNQID